jgi:serine/threonine protein kinase
LLTLLDRVSAPEYPDSGLSRPAREILSSLSHARAVAWIIARLAEALGHAYRLGVTHGDLKPSNILLTADGEPMLLDFNLAVDWRSTHGAERVHESGTLAYMAPERLRAIGDPSRTPPRAGDRHRADIYSLGLVLLETLTGRAPTVPDGPDRSPRAIASALAEARGKEVKRSGWPAIPPSLRPILSRCLAADPADRYSSALHLAEDLDRWRTDLAPIHAPAPPGHMDLMRWARRQRVPLIAAALTLATGILSASIASIWSAETSRRLALEKLRITRTNSELGGFRYRLPGRWTPISSGDPVKLANARLKHYHVLDPTVDWRTRDDVRALPERERDELEAWVLEQAWRLSLALEVRSDDPENLKRALRDLERVAGLRTAGPIERRLRALRRRLGWPESPPRSVSTAPPWMEAYLRGVELEDHFPGEAAACFRQALAERPGFYWAQHHLASVLGRLGGNLEAAAYLRHCVERYPDCAWLRQEMGTRLLVLGQLEEAREQFDLAAVLDPDLDVAYRDRLLVRARLGQLHETQADLIRFASLTRPPGDSPPVHLRLLSARFLQNRLLASQLSEEESAQIHEAARAQPHDVELGIWSAIRFQLAGKNQEAFDEWNRIHQLEPNNLYIRYYRAYMLRYFDKTTSAQEMREILADRRFEELLALAPDVKRIFHMAAFDAFHDGRPADTVAIAQRGLELLKGDLEDLTLTGTLHYAIANALMVPSPGDPGDADIERIASHLNQAFRDRPDLLPHYAEADNKLSDPVMDRIRPLLRLRSPSSL